jgi:hypothetical protein
MKNHYHAPLFGVCLGVRQNIHDIIIVIQETRKVILNLISVCTGFMNRLYLNSITAICIYSK